MHAEHVHWKFPHRALVKLHHLENLYQRLLCESLSSSHTIETHFTTIQFLAHSFFCVLLFQQFTYQNVQLSQDISAMTFCICAIFTFRNKCIFRHFFLIENSFPCVMFITFYCSFQLFWFLQLVCTISASFSLFHFVRANFSFCLISTYICYFKLNVLL